MVKIKRERKFEFEEGKATAIMVDKFVNGAGRDIERITREKGITKEEAEKVVNEMVIEELTKIDKELTKKKDEMSELKDMISMFEDTPEFKEFRALVNSEEFKSNMEKLSKIDAYKTGEVSLMYLEEQKEDVLNWKKQMEGIRDGYN